MLAWVLTATVAQGGVKTEDSTVPGCLEEETVELEVRAAVGDETVDSMELLVQLSGTEKWQLALTVRNTSGTIWNRIVPAEPVDCPYLTELVGQSFERGLSELPGWGLPAAERSGPEFGFIASATWPKAMRFGVGFDLWFHLTDRFGLDLQLSGVQSAVEPVQAPVGGDRAGVSFVASQLEAGPGLSLPLFQKQQLRLSSRIGVGAGLAIGLEFGDHNRIHSRPRVPWVSDVLWAPNRNIRFGPRVEVALAGAQFSTDTQGHLLFQEPRVRAGLVLGISERLGKGDGSRSQRR